MTNDKLHELQKRNLSNAAKLRERLKRLHDEEGWSYREFVDLAGLERTDDNKLRDFVNAEILHRLTASNFAKLVRYLYDKDLWYFDRPPVDDGSDALYYTLGKFLNIKFSQEADLKERTAGLYRVWRRSILLSGRYTVGYAKIYTDPKTRALCVSEFYMYEEEADPAKPDKLPFRIIKDQYVGYLIRKNQRYLIVTRNASISHLQITMLADISRDVGPVTLMSGMVQGTAGGRLFSSPVLYERYDSTTADEARAEAELANTAGVFDAERIPDVVLAKLAKPTLHDADID